MGTHCFISVKKKNGSVNSSFCHYDGFIDYTGQKLLSNYNNQELAENLVQGGNLSGINDDGSPDYSKPSNVVVINGQWVKLKEPIIDDYNISFDDFERVKQKIVESGGKPDEYVNIYGIEYYYYWDGTQWFVYDTQTQDGFVPLEGHNKLNDVMV